MKTWNMVRLWRVPGPILPPAAAEAKGWDFVLEEGGVPVLASPAPEAALLVVLARGFRLQCVGVVRAGASHWLEITDAAGLRGFIHGSVRVRRLGCPSHPGWTLADALGEMLSGGIAGVLGLLVLEIAECFGGESGGVFPIAGGLLLFGGVRLLRGFFHLPGYFDGPAQD